MAKLTSLLPFTGSLRGLTAYTLPGVDTPVVRATSGPSKEDIQTKPQYDITRRINREFGGRSRAASRILQALYPLKPLADYDTAGRLNRLLVPVQQLDTESEYGKRAVQLTRHPGLLEGFHLTKASPFDAVVRGVACGALSKANLDAVVEVPALIPGLTYFPADGYALYRVVAVLGVVPDLFLEGPKYAPLRDYSSCTAQPTATGWFPARSGSPALALEVSLPYTPPDEAFTLVLSVGLQVGAPNGAGAVEPVRKGGGCAKILAAV